MIRGLGSQNANIYNNNSGSAKSKEATSTSEQKETRVEQLKAAIEDGEYKVDLDKLAKKMAEDLS